MENFLFILSNPWFWAIFIPVLFIEPFLKYIRRFYSKKAQEEIVKCESVTHKALEKKLNKVVSLLILFGTIVITPIFIFIDYLVSSNFTISIMLIISASITSLALVTFFHNKILKYTFDADYDRYYESLPKSEFFIMTNMHYFGFFFLVFGILGFISASSLSKTLGLN